MLGRAHQLRVSEPAEWCSDVVRAIGCVAEGCSDHRLQIERITKICQWPEGILMIYSSLSNMFVRFFSSFSVHGRKCFYSIQTTIWKKNFMLLSDFNENISWFSEILIVLRAVRCITEGCFIHRQIESSSQVLSDIDENHSASLKYYTFFGRLSGAWRKVALYPCIVGHLIVELRRWNVLCHCDLVSFINANRKLQGRR